MNRSINILLAHLSEKQIRGYVTNQRLGKDIIPLIFPRHKIAVTMQVHDCLDETWLQYTPSINTIKQGVASSMIESFLALREPKKDEEMDVA